MNELNEKDLIISIVVGYMLKLMKLSININEFKPEFSAIRHGDYDKFIKLINVEEPLIVSYNNGIIKTSNFSQKNGDCDFLMLNVSGNALKFFYIKCKKKYGNIIDSDIDDETYKKLVLFEISLRMHSNNNNIPKSKNLIDVIKSLVIFEHLSKDEEKKLQRGREFLNYVKHTTNKFNSYEEGILVINDAYNILIENKLTII